MRLALAAALVVAMSPAFAVQPDEVLSDPELESRARELSRELRCLVCRNESIDESNADLARDLRLLVRERLVEGDSNTEVIDYVVDRYGEYVLLRPTRTGANMLLWIAGPAMLVVALGIGIGYQRRNRLTRETPVEGLNDDEAARLKQILND